MLLKFLKHFNKSNSLDFCSKILTKSVYFKLYSNLTIMPPKKANTKRKVSLKTPYISFLFFKYAHFQLKGRSCFAWDTAGKRSIFSC